MPLFTDIVVFNVVIKGGGVKPMLKNTDFIMAFWHKIDIENQSPMLHLNNLIFGVSLHIDTSKFRKPVTKMNFVFFRDTLL